MSSFLSHDGFFLSRHIMIISHWNLFSGLIQPNDTSFKWIFHKTERKNILQRGAWFYFYLLSRVKRYLPQPTVFQLHNIFQSFRGMRKFEIYETCFAMTGNYWRSFFSQREYTCPTCEALQTTYVNLSSIFANKIVFRFIIYRYASYFFLLR